MQKKQKKQKETKKIMDKKNKQFPERLLIMVF